MDALIDVQAVAAEAFATLDTGHQIEPFSLRLSSFNLDDAHRLTAAVRKMRKARGELPVARKIGFTNRAISAEDNVYEPVRGYVYDRTVHNLSEIGDTFPLVGLALGWRRPALTASAAGVCHLSFARAESVRGTRKGNK
jgi:2-oxo-3-hexenedioate decarboxylase